jgi:hypothetical protein
VHGRRPVPIAFAAKEAIECELIIASHGEPVHEKVLHVQAVARFNGMATKYLPNFSAGG